MAHNEISDGYAYHFVKGMRGFWATKHTEDTANDRHLFIKTTIRELLVYLGFLIVLIIITFGMTNSLNYYYTNFLNGLFTTPFSSGFSVDDFWKYLNGPLMTGLYWNQWYNNNSVINSEINFIMYSNKLIAVPRLRQVRVRNNSCAIPTDFQKDIKLCYAQYSLSVESSDPFGPGNSTAWTYTNQTTLNGRISEGSVNNYGGGGYYVDLNRTSADSRDTLTFLFKNLWIDRGTRAVLIDFTVYNANLNLFSVIKLIAEFPATGGMIPFSSYRTVKLIRYLTSQDYLVMAFELVFVVYILYYIVEEVLEIKKHKLSYFFSFWNCLDIGVIMLSLLSVGFSICRTITVNNLITQLLRRRRRYANFDNISFLQVQFDYIIAITLFFAWIKIFKYISFNQTMNQLNNTLSRSAYDLSGFAVMFLVIFSGFAQLGYLLFGTQVTNFNAFISTAYSLLRIILGEFNLTQLDQSNRILGPIYFVLYVFFVFIVLFNIFMAIIIETYGDVKQELATKANEIEMADYIREKANVMLGKLNIRREKLIGIQDAMGFADTDGDHKIDFGEWKIELKKRGYGDAEIEAVFDKYDTDGDQVLDLGEQQQMQRELENQKAALNQEIQKSETENILGIAAEEIVEIVSFEQQTLLTTRVDRMEKRIKSVVEKMDEALQNMVNIEKYNSKKRELLGRILKTLKSDEYMTDEERNKRLEGMIRDEIGRINKYGQRSGADFQSK